MNNFFCDYIVKISKNYSTIGTSFFPIKFYSNRFAIIRVVLLTRIRMTITKIIISIMQPFPLFICLIVEYIDTEV